MCVCVYVCACSLLYGCYIPAGFLHVRLAHSPGYGSPLVVCLSRRGEALLSLSLPGGGISSPTRRERAEREEGRRVGGVAWCVCVCVCVHACMLVRDFDTT